MRGRSGATVARGAISFGSRSRGTAWARSGLLARSVARNIECIVNHIYEDGLVLPLRVESGAGTGAEAIPRRMTGRMGATVFGRARERSTYMIVLARHAIFWRGLVVRLRVPRVIAGVFGCRVAGLASVSSRAARRCVCVGVLRGVVGVVRRGGWRLTVVVGRPPRWWTGVMIHYRRSMSRWQLEVWEDVQRSQVVREN